MSGGQQCRGLSAKGNRCLRSAETGFDTCPPHRSPLFQRVDGDDEAPNRCAGTTAAGAPCGRLATEGRDVCYNHDAQPAPRKQRRMARSTAGIVALPPPMAPGERPKRNRNTFELRQQWDELCDRIADGMRPYRAADSLGFHRQAFSDLLRNDPDRVADVLAAEAVAAEAVEDALFKRALQGDARAASTWLGNRSPDRWRDIRRVEVSGSVQHELEAGPMLERIAELQNRLKARQQLALESGDVIEAEVVDEADEQ